MRHPVRREAQCRFAFVSRQDPFENFFRGRQADAAKGRRQKAEVGTCFAAFSEGGRLQRAEGRRQMSGAATERMSGRQRKDEATPPHFCPLPSAFSPHEPPGGRNPPEVGLRRFPASPVSSNIRSPADLPPERDEI